MRKHQANMTIGSVKFFDRARGFGFIVPDSGGQDVFVDKAAVQFAGISFLEKGQRFSYELAQDAKGASKAIKLEAISPLVAVASAEKYSPRYVRQPGPSGKSNLASGRSSFAARRGGRAGDGMASQLVECQRKYEFYSNLGRDAFNDPVAREGYLQHAEHFYRAIKDTPT